MRQTNNDITGWRMPSKEEKAIITQQWGEGIGDKYIGFWRNCGLIFMVLCALMLVLKLFSLPESMGSILALLIGAGFFLLLFVRMNHRIKRVHKILDVLEAGRFMVVNGTGLQCFVYRGNRHYVGSLSVELDNGQNVENLCVPYKTAKRMRRKKRYPVLIVKIADENRLFAFDME